jgi:hypothetical protein
MATSPRSPYSRSAFGIFVDRVRLRGAVNNYEMIAPKNPYAQTSHVREHIFDCAIYADSPLFAANEPVVAASLSDFFVR